MTTTINPTKSELWKRSDANNYDFIDWEAAIAEHQEELLRTDPCLYYSTKHREAVVSTEGMFDFEARDAFVTATGGIPTFFLNSYNMFIADVDEGDSRLLPHVGAVNLQELCNNVNELHLLDAELPDLYRKLKLADQSYRIYRTMNGWRVLCTSAELPFDTGFRFRSDSRYHNAVAVLRFLRSDPEYVKLCRFRKYYSARLTRDHELDREDPYHACELVEVIGDDRIHPKLAEQIRLRYC